MMMSEKVEVKVIRIKKGHPGSRPVGGGFTHGVIPADGFVVSTNDPMAIPIYIRDEDLERARVSTGRNERPVPVIAESWGS